MAWTKNPPFKFTNADGDVWIAEISKDGKTITLTGNDVEWDLCEVEATENFEPPFVMRKSEMMWLESVVLEALDRQRR